MDKICKETLELEEIPFSFLLHLFVSTFSITSVFISMMSLISCVPLRCIKRIIYLVVGENAYNLSQWKKKLPIIGVCQLWRYIGLPLVYNQVFFEDYDVFLDDIETTRRLRRIYLRQRGISVIGPILVSNIDLLTALNQCYLLKEINIVANKNGQQHLFLDKLYRLFQLSRCSWEYVRSVNILGYGIFNDHYFYYALPVIEDNNYNLNSIIKYFKKNFSALCYINYNSYDSLLSRLSRQLNGTFIEQLYIIKTNMSFACALPYLPQHITKLYLTFDKTETVLQLPIIFAESLEDLELHNVPPDFDWTCFQNPEMPYYTNVNSANLQGLVVSYRANYDKDGNLVYNLPESDERLRFKFIFSKLESLIIIDCSRNNSLLYAEFPNIIDFVIFEGPISSIALCNLIRVKARVYKITVSSAAKHEELMFYNTTNAMCTDKNYRTSSLLQLQSIYFPIDAELIKWNNIGSIAIGFPIKSETFILLLQKLPSLDRLILEQDLIFAIVDTLDYTALFQYTQNLEFVLCSKLELIYFHCEAYPYKYQETLDLILFIISRCPKLEYAAVRHLFNGDIHDFVQKYSSMFPHLSDLNIDCPLDYRLNFNIFL